MYSRSILTKLSSDFQQMRSLPEYNEGTANCAVWGTVDLPPPIVLACALWAFSAHAGESERLQTALCSSLIWWPGVQHGCMRRPLHRLALLDLKPWVWRGWGQSVRRLFQGEVYPSIYIWAHRTWKLTRWRRHKRMKWGVGGNGSTPFSNGFTSPVWKVQEVR